MSVFLHEYYEVLHEDADKSEKEEALKWNLILNERINKAMSKFSKVSVIDDFVRENQPLPEDYGLTDSDIDYFSNLENSEVNKEESKGCLIPIAVILIIALICFIMGQWGYMIFAPVVALFFIDRDDTSTENIRKRVFKRDARSRLYYSYLDDKKEYDSKYAYGEDKIV